MAYTIDFDLEECVLTIEFAEDKKLASNQLVKVALERFIDVLRAHENLGRLVLIRGSVPLCVIAAIAIQVYQYAYVPLAIGVFDPELKKYVIIFSANPHRNIGELIS